MLGTMKVAAPDGALAVFGLDGRLRHLVTGPDRPNNVDADYGLDVGGTSTDIAVLTERLGRRRGRNSPWHRGGHEQLGPELPALPVDDIAAAARPPLAIDPRRHHDGRRRSSTRRF